MSYSEQQHLILKWLREKTIEIGRVPMRHEFQALFPKLNFDVLFGSYDNMLVASGVTQARVDNVKPQNEKPFKYKFITQKIESFSLVSTDLSELFRRAGNPEVLRGVFMPDTHVENRDKAAVSAFIKFLSWYSPDLFCIMGDFLDAEGISHWPSDKLQPRDFMKEVKEGRALLSEIQDSTKNCTSRFFITGNHEDWIRQAMVQKMPQFFNGLDELGLTPDLQKLLELDRFEYNLIPLNQILQIGKANFTHGLYTGNSHAKKHLDTIKGNIYYGHLHDMLETHQPSLNGYIEAASLGCLCRLDAPFMKGKPTNWVHGFGVFEFFPDGTYSRYQVKIFDGKFSFNGKVFSA